ncbi:hypothetical protein SAMN05661096_02768 [Marivirga sericea]|uniref:Copper-binding protein MbnP-like domain-containing protein n=2 Tax=Marivirga sericea TaxID=1028 RepID=A0A1X7KHR9_9BACT|nr:hypothetical protein SAMN05661096_02768 [Marivirga sericea]
MYASTLVLALSVTSCNDTKELDKGTLIIQFENLLDGEALKFEGTRYNRDQVDFQIAVLKYYISNVKFLDETGQVIYTEEESYHLLEETASRKDLAIELTELEVQEVSSIEFSIGIDPEKNLSLDNTGDLDPSNEMAWNWDTGYKFLLMEGEIFESEGTRKGMVYHIGGNENYKTIKKEVNTKIKAGTTTTIEIKAEVLSLFDAPHYININEVNVAMGGENASKIAENYANNFFSINTPN